MIYLKIIGIALALFVVLRYISSVIPVLANKTRIRNASLRFFPVAEMIIWVYYIFWASHQLFEDIGSYPLITGSLIITLVAIFGWYLLRDFISGIILKAENTFEPGQTIHTSLASGQIKKLGYRSMEIVNIEGEYVKIPYARLSRMVISKPSDNVKWIEHGIKIKVPSGFPSEKIQTMLKRRMLEMPWIISGENIRLEITREDGNGYLAEIYFHSLSPEMAIKTDENLKAFVKEVFPEKEG